MSNQLVKVKRDRILACITCPLCHKLFRHATTISECLHTFCRKCIYKKLSDEELESCPVCNINLGGVPIEKLRPDHNLEDVRAKMFPYKRQKVEAPVIMPPVTLPVRRKEMSLSSLVVSTPRVSVQTEKTGRRSKSSARKALQGSTFSVDEPIKNVEDFGEEPDSSTSPETLKIFTQNERLNSSNAKPCSHPRPDRDTNNCADQREGEVNLCKPLNCLVEVERGSKCSRFTSEGSIGQKLKVESDNNKHGPASLESEKPKKLRIIRRKKASTFGELSILPQTVLNSVSVKCQRRANPIWFSLVASEDQQGDAPLPQISASYLRIKDGNIPVSFIQKYLMKKLDLSSEDEVEIRYMGQLIPPTQQLNNLVDIWLQTTESEIVPAVVGSSAKDFLMVLAYARKISTCPCLSLHLHEAGKANSEIPAPTFGHFIPIPEDMNLLSDIRAFEVFSDELRGLVGPLERDALQGLTTKDLAKAEVVAHIKGLVQSVFCYRKRGVEREELDELDRLKAGNFCLTEELGMARNLLEVNKRELTRLREQKIADVARLSVLEAEKHGLLEQVIGVAQFHNVAEAKKKLDVEIANFNKAFAELQARSSGGDQMLHEATQRADTLEVDDLKNTITQLEQRVKDAEGESALLRERVAKLGREKEVDRQRLQKLEAEKQKFETEMHHIMYWAPIEAYHEYLKHFDPTTFNLEREKTQTAGLVRLARRRAGYDSSSDVECSSGASSWDEEGREDDGSGDEE